MSKKIANEVTAEINTLESQGKALNAKWKRIVRAEKKQIVDFDLPLGKVMVALAAEAGGVAIAKLKRLVGPSACSGGNRSAKSTVSCA